MDQKIIEFISFIALTSVMVERITELFKPKILNLIKPTDNKLTIILLTVLISTGLVTLNFDTFIYPIYLNHWVAFIFVVAGSSSGSSMWNNILSAIENKKLTTK